MPKGAGRLHSHRDAAGTVQPERKVCVALRQARLQQYCGLGECNAVQWVGGVPNTTSTARAVQLLLHGVGSHGVSGLRAPADAECNGLSTKQRFYSKKAGSGRLARSRLLRPDIIGEMVATEERREYHEGVRCPHGLFDPNNSGGIALRLDGHE